MKKQVVQAGLGLFMLATLPQAVMAAMTEAGTTVVNTASVAYKVSGADQTPVAGSAQFVVDRKVALTVAYQGAVPVQVVPGQQGVALKYKLTNLSNSNLDFVLAAADVTAATVLGALGTDTKDAVAASLVIHADDGTGNAPGGVLAGSRVAGLVRDDTGVTGANEVIIWVLGNIPAAYDVNNMPNGVANNDIIGVSLTATAHALTADGGAALTDDKQTADSPAAPIQNVFADAAGAADVAQDGKHSAYGAYLVRTVELTLSKTSRTIWDPINLFGNGTTVFPKAIPGAVVEYCLLIQNPGALPATNLVVSDVLPLTTTYYAGTGTPALAAALQGVTTGANANCGNASGQHGAAYGSFNASLPAASKGTVTATFPSPAIEILPSETSGSPTPGYAPIWVRFHVVVD